MAGDNFVVWRERKNEDIGLDSARSGSGPVRVGQASPPDPEVVEKASRKQVTFTNNCKRKQKVEYPTVVLYNILYKDTY